MKNNEETSNKRKIFKEYLSERDKVLLPYYRLKAIMEDRFMSVGGMADLINVTNTMILNWHAQITHVKVEKEKKEKSWHRYSMMDCICFHVLRVLKYKGIPIKQTILLYHWLQRELQDVQVLIHYFQRRSMVITYDFDEPELVLLHKEQEKLIKKIYKGKQPIMIVKLNVIIDDVIENEPFGLKDDLRCGEDKKTTYYRANLEGWVMLKDLPSNPLDTDR